ADCISKNERLVLHALNCNCNNDSCLGYLFVKEDECPLCKPDVAISLSNHLEKWGEKIDKEINKNLCDFHKYGGHMSNDSGTDSEEHSENSGNDSDNDFPKYLADYSDIIDDSDE